MANQAVIATTLQLLRDKLVDQSYLSTPFVSALRDAGSVVEQDGGRRVEQSIVIGEHSQITQLTNGYESVNMAVQDPFQTAVFEWSTFTAPITISDVDRLSNRGSLAVANALEAKVKNVMQSSRSAINERFIKGSGTLTDLQTLNGMGVSGGSADTTGWLEGVVQASQVNVVGGLSKATYQADGWFNPFVDAGGTLTLAHLDELMITAQLVNPAGKMPDIILMSQSCWTAFQALQTAFSAPPTAEGRVSLAGAPLAMWRGAKIYVDPFLGFTGVTPAKAVSAYVLSSDSFRLYIDPEADLSISDMLPIPGTATYASRLINRSQLVANHLGSLGVLLAAEA